MSEFVTSGSGLGDSDNTAPPTASVIATASLSECEMIKTEMEIKMETQWPLALLTPLAVEAALLTVCIRWPNEVGFIHTQPSFRLVKIRHASRSLGIPLLTTLSLRRHWVQENHKGKPESFLRLGTSIQKQHSATIFEEIVARHLDHLRVCYLTEKDQQAAATAPYGPTPDFLLSPPIRIANQLIHWIEVKHFYGAGTIPIGKSTCGKLPAKSKSYVDAFGPGAYVFAYGCCEELHAAMAEGVLVLDERELLPYLEPLHVHLRTWCADGNGEILP